MQIYTAKISSGGELVWKEDKPPFSPVWKFLAAGSPTDSLLVDNSTISDYSVTISSADGVMVISGLDERAARSLALAWLREDSGVKHLFARANAEADAEGLIAANPVDAYGYMPTVGFCSDWDGAAHAAELLRTLKLSPGLGVRLAFSASVDVEKMKQDGADIILSQSFATKPAQRSGLRERGRRIFNSLVNVEKIAKHVREDVQQGKTRVKEYCLSPGGKVVLVCLCVGVAYLLLRRRGS